MAVESVSAAETLIQSTDNDDLEDGEIPSDEDDEPVSCVVTNNVPEATKSPPLKCDSTKTKEFDVKFNKNKKQQQSPQAANKHDRFLKYNDPSEDWAADVEKAIKAAMQEDGGRNQETKKNKNNRNKIRKRAREEREDERAKDQKKQKVSEEENPNDDEDEMLFVRGASPVRKDSQERDSPPKHANEHENFEGVSDHEEKPNVNRHKENENNKRGNVRSGGGGGSGGRRGGKNERGKNKNRNQGRNDRNNRRQQNNDHSEPDQICVYYMQGKCHRGEDCPFSHNALPPRKMELCKFYLMDCCAKRDKCLYMHHDFPCKFFHTGVKCVQGDNCKFSHKPLNDQVKNILLKHLETAPKEILGDFPRLSRESAMLMINNTARSLAQGQDAANQKIPSLFELKVSEPIENLEEKEEKEEQMNQHKGNARERKPSGKKTRWGSDEDRVPYEQIMLLQSANKLGLQLPNAALGLATQQHKQSQDVPNFYTERNAESNVHKTADDFTKDVGEENMETERKDIDLRQLLNKKKSSAMSTYYRLAEKMVDLPKPTDEESDQDDESNLVIEMPVEDEDKEKGKHHSSDSNEVHNVYFSTADEAETAPPNLPKKAQELFMRIQQQQRAAQDSFKNLESDSTARRTDQIVEDWYSDDEDDDDDEGGGLTIVDSSKDDVEMAEPVVKTENESTPPSNIPQPAAIVDKLGDLSKIDISAEVSKLLSTLKAQSSTTSSKTQTSKAKSPSRTDGETSSSPRQQSPGPTPVAMPVSRDPRMSSRDPRQRRETEQKPSSPSIVEAKKEKPLRLETSIYSSGITAMDANMDTDLRTKADQDLRRQDMDFRQRFHTSDFGDTDLRVKSDVDLRQILSLPFKPAPSHVPCTEIDASIASHPPMAYSLYVVDIPRPDYTGLKLSKNDAQVKYDPRLRKIFRISKPEQVADSPMSPPPQQMKQEIPKSPPQCIRSDPRRKTLEAAAASSQQASQSVMSASMMSKGPMQSMETMGPSMGMQMGPTGIPGNIPGPPQMMGPMGPNHPMGMSNMGPMNHPMGPMMNAGPMPSMGMPPNAPIGMNGPVAMPPQSQMNFDPRFNVQRNNGAGLLGPAPGAFGPDPPFEGGGTSYPSGGNFSNFGPGGSGGPGDPGMMGFNPNASNGPNFGPMAGDGPDWGTGGNRRGNRIRRRNRNRTNMVTN
ncbi:protein suppressor of sable isoform X2 [Pseudomyrmex gracilis]|uniref:protein suppressor of sable isoform X2 n=1 Tax=Pseudomyrmex gracilis TaxID=219809 RepID=UPI000995186F|nr:protein suppressor of sable isoform X2 [Pseudomyrmex gracilis]XP_020283542.1 protein suppressor of sable isoform X2 [Pseudomyrmex gracilis]XP_020283543.1 protein suppressor of sable isoform X2 [Pseudomyrmex gracilis]XP_020283545.1 protein suppressor of sable isoform X2 [Pseudomyrmex gracilis]